MDITVKQLAEHCIEWLHKCHSEAQDEKSRARLDNRLADFNLWCDGVGARAGSRASLDKRFQSRPDDLVMIKGMLTLLRQFLENYAELLRGTQDTDEALRNVDSALENLALLAMAIRQTGRKARLEKADSKYDPDDHHLLRDHLEFILRIQRDSTHDDPVGYKLTCLDWRQHRLVDANLRRRNRFIQAQKHHKYLESKPTAQETVRPHQPEPRNTSHDTQNESTKHATLQTQRLLIAKSTNARENTVSGTSASAPDSKMNLDFRQVRRPSPAIEVPRTVITKVNASTSYPHVNVPPGQQSFQCPSCCQTLTREHAIDENLWRKHLSNDISPYTCIADKCPSPFVFYNTTADLEHHLRHHHPQTWQCPLCEDFPPSFEREEFMESHFQTVHREVDSVEWSGLLSMSLQYGLGINACPFCGESDDIVDSPELIGHVLEHMHNFSLLSLPWAKKTSDANTDGDLLFNPFYPNLLLKPRDTRKINLSTSSEPLTAIERLIPWLESDAMATVRDVADIQENRLEAEHEPIYDSPDFFSTHLYFDDQSTNASGRTQEEDKPPASNLKEDTAFYDRTEIIQVFENFKSEFFHLLSLGTNENTTISELVAKTHSIEPEIQTFDLADYDNILLTLNKIRVTICEFCTIHMNTGTDTSAYLSAMLEEIRSDLDSLQLALQQSENQLGILNAAHKIENKDADEEKKGVKEENISQAPAEKHAIQRLLTFRISNVPRAITKDEFLGILHRLPTTPGGVDGQSNLLGLSYSPAAVCTLAERYAVATATFADAPTLGDLEKAIKREIGVGASRLIVDLDFLGLTPLADPLQDTVADIIAVTGLAGHAFGSWKSKNKPDMWLRDFLPESIPNARIMTYGYDTKLPGSQSEASIMELSRRLLESIKTTRDEGTRNRPLIIIGHSLGGLVVKQALVEASGGSEEDLALFRSCYAVLLFAVPNRGLDNISLMSMVKGQPNEELIRDLSEHYRYLSLLHQMFNKCFTLNDSKIICVYETEKTPTVQWNSDTGSWERTGPKVMMVPHTSAIDAGPNEKAYDQLSINSDHFSIVKFSHSSNGDYLIIESRIKILVQNSSEVIRERFASFKRKLSRIEAQYIEALKAPDYRSFREHKVDTPTSGTLGWFLERPEYCSWQTPDNPSILWVKGSPGQGKTILAKFLLDHLENLPPIPNCYTTVIYFFFSDQDDNHRTVGGAIRSIIKQLLSARDAFHIISDKFNIETSTITDESAWDIAEELLQSPFFGTIYCVIDALDECQDERSRNRLLEFFKRLIQPPLAKKREKLSALKIFLTSRPTVDLGRILKQFPCIHLKASPDDLKAFIYNKIDVLELATEHKSRVIDLLSKHVEQTFLWISIVLKKLTVASALLSLADMEQIIDESPSGLMELYEGIVSQIMQSNVIAAQKLLTWTVFGRRALTLDELEVALAIQDNSNDQESIEKHRIPLTESSVTSSVGIILEIVDGKVYLIHQSAKDFLLKSEYLSEAGFCRGLHPNLYLAKICMTYLCFTDFVKTGPCQDPELLKERIRRYPFFFYAARNWHRHIGINDNTSSFAVLIRQLTKPGSPGLLSWSEAAGITNLDEATDILDIATKAYIPWLADFHSNDDLVTEDMVEKAFRRGRAGYTWLKKLARKPGVSFTDGAVCVAARCFDHELIRLLSGTGITITPELIEAAVTNNKYGWFVMDVLLELQSSFEITAKLVQLAAGNRDSGKDILELMLQKDNTYISEEAVIAIAATAEVETMRFLLNSREDIKINTPVLLAATGRQDMNKGMVTFLLEKQNDDNPIAEEVLMWVAQHLGQDTMYLLLDRRRYQIVITENIIWAAIRNEDTGVLELLFSRRGDEITITEDIAKHMCTIHWEGIDLVTILLNQQEHQSAVTQEALIIIAEFSTNALISLLLGPRGDQIIITEPVFRALIWKSNKEQLALLLDRRGEEITITGGFVEAAAGNEYYGKEIMELFLSRLEGQLTIKKHIIELAADNRRSGRSIMRLLLSQREDKVVIAEDLLEFAVGENGKWPGLDQDLESEEDLD